MTDLEFAIPGSVRSLVIDSENDAGDLPARAWERRPLGGTPAGWRFAFPIETT